MPYEIRRAEALPRHLAAVTAMATLPEMPHVIPRKLGEVWQFVADHMVTSTCHNVVVYLNSHAGGNETLFDMLCGVVPLAGPSWEVYGGWSDDPSKLRTDVFCLLAG